MRAHRRRSGQALPLAALLMALLIGAVGMAIDSGRAYLVKARLAAAVDAAALAAARAVSRGEDAASRQASAVAAATRAFDANYPDGYLGAAPLLRMPQVRLEEGRVLVDISASARLPLGLSAAMGFTRLDIEASSQAARRDLDLALVLDASTSLLPAAREVREAAGLFLERFSPDTDRVALVRFAHGAEVDAPIRAAERGFDRPALRQRLEAVQFHGYTNSAEGLWQAHSQLNAVPPARRSSLRAMVFFSDGVPTAFAARFAVTAPAGCNVPAVLISDIDGVSVRGLWQMDRQETPLPGCDAVALSPQALPLFYDAHGERTQLPIVGGVPRSVGAAPTWSNVNRAARNLAEAMASRARADGIHIYTIGLGPELDRLAGADPESGSDLLRCMANSLDAPPRCRAPSEPAGVHCHASDAADLKACFAILGAEILRLTR